MAPPLDRTKALWEPLNNKLARKVLSVWAARPCRKNQTSCLNQKSGAHLVSSHHRSSRFGTVAIYRGPDNDESTRRNGVSSDET